jgi:hypothetical protein
MRWQSLLALFFYLVPAMAAERVFDFGDTRENETPRGFRSALTGRGNPGEWRVMMDDAPSLLPPLSPQAPSVSKRPVLAQLSQDPTDERFPLFVYEGETFADFTMTAKLKTVRGVTEQMAGIAFRIQNETNYYVARISSLGNTFRFYKVVDGQRSPPIGRNLSLPTGVWHELSISCKGNQIQFLLNGREAMPAVTDSSFNAGKIGFWTKSDSVSYFTDAKIVYTPREVPAQVLVRGTLEKYPRLLGLEVFVAEKGGGTRLVAAGDEKDIGRSGGKPEGAVIGEGATYYGKTNQSVSVVLPLRDRNGEVIAAVRVIMRTFKGQTEENAVLRAQPIVKEMQARVRSPRDLIDEP